MSNTELTKYYMSLQFNNNKMNKVSHDNILSELDKHFNYQWTWELDDEKILLDNTAVSTTITLYTPGKIYTGRSYVKIKDYQVNHLYAILNACQSFMETNDINNNQSIVNENINNQQMTANQIMEALNQQPQQSVNTVNDFYEYKKSDSNLPDGVPFDEITDNCFNELQQELGAKSSSPIQQESNNGQDYDAPLDKYKGFSQRQVDRLNQFKKDFDIINNEMFGNYVNMWDNNLHDKNHITPTNANAFLDWIDELKKQGC